MLHEFLQVNYAALAGCLFLSVFILTNRLFHPETIKLFWYTILCTLVLVAADSLELWASSWAYPSKFRVFMSIIGYTLRPFGAYCLLCILNRESRKKKTWLAIPLLFNAVCVFSAFFTPITFSYSSENAFVRGPLGMVPFLVSGFYLFAIVFFTLRTYQEGNRLESLIAFCISITLGLASILESAFGFIGLLNVSSSLSVIFYYLYLHTQQFIRDPLTNLLNRRCFYLDAEAHLNSEFAIISLDLNNLKQINDTQGHAAGDTAICDTVNCIKQNLPRGYRFYRVGGDEFMILAFSQQKDLIETVIRSIRVDINKSPYRCAIGTAYYDPNSNFEQAVVHADSEMYEDKRQSKMKLNKTL